MNEKCRLYSAKVKAKGTSEDGVATVEYNIAKRNAKKVIGKVKEEEGRRLRENLDSEDGKCRVFKVVKQMMENNKNVTRGGCIRDSSGQILVEEEKIKERC